MVTLLVRSGRMLRRRWALTAIAVFSLSIAMALCIVTVSVANTFMFARPAAVAADRLVAIYTRSSESPIDGISYPDYQYFRATNHVFSDVAASPNQVTVLEDLDFGGREVRVFAKPISDNYLTLMGIRPYLGRFFQPGDDASKTAVAVMTYSCWKRLGSDPHIVGKVLASNTVIGVTPETFTGSFYGFNGDLLLPLTQLDQGTPQWRTQRDTRLLFLVARLRAGVTQREAQAELTTLSSQLATAYPKEDKGQAAVVTRPTLLGPGGLQDAELLGAVLMAGVLLVLLIACANVANLLLTVAVGRRQEAATKMALGASRGRLIREFLIESAIICALSSALGYVTAAGVIARFSDFTVVLPMFGTYSFAIDLRLDAAVIGCAVALTLLATVATGLAPARYASSPALAQMLSGELVVGGTRKGTRRNALVIIQVAVCTLALVGMGLCQRSLYNLRHVDPGFSARNLVAAIVVVRGQGESAAQVGERFAALRREVSALPGVESVSLASDLPLLADHAEAVRVPGRDQPVPSVGDMTVDGAYFATFGVRVRAGRVFVASDGQNGLDTVVINRTLAEKLWPGQDAVGQRVAVGDPARPAQVIGVVEDGKYGDLNEAVRPFLYHALRPDGSDGTIIVVARTRSNPDLWLAPLANAVRDLHLTLLWSPVTFDGWMNFTLLADRVAAGWAAGLSALGVLLVVVGLFGAISCSVSERKRELALRAALGARPRQLLEMVLRHTLLITGIGTAIGIVLGVAATILLRSEFYQIGAVEWSVLIPVSVGMLVTALVVAFFSARPWITIDPLEAVRHA